MNINNLTTSISEMSSNDLLNHMREVRKRRRLVPVKKEKKSKKKKTSVISIDTLISSLPDTDKEALIKLLEEVK